MYRACSTAFSMPSTNSNPDEGSGCSALPLVLVRPAPTEHPIVQDLTVIAEAPAWFVVRCSDESAERHGDVEYDLSHDDPSFSCTPGSGIRGRTLTTWTPLARRSHRRPRKVLLLQGRKRSASERFADGRQALWLDPPPHPPPAFFADEETSFGQHLGVV
jgi:hypothetical protein